MQSLQRKKSLSRRRNGCHDGNQIYDKIQIAKAVNATVIPLEEAPKGYEDFDKGAAKKFVLNPNNMISV